MSYGIDYYRSKLRLDKHALDDALEEQADMLDQIGREVTRAARAEAEAEDALKREEGRLSLRLKGGEEKLTVPEVAATVRNSRERAGAMRELLDAAELHSSWKSVYAAWKDRGYSIKELAGLHAASYFTASSHTMPRMPRGRPDQDTRDAIRRASEEVRDARAARVALTSAHEAGAEPRTVRRRITE